MRPHGGRGPAAGPRIGVAHARAVRAIDVARASQPIEDRPDAGIGIIDDRRADPVRGLAVRQHAGAEPGERIPVLALRCLAFPIQMLGETCLEEIDGRQIEHVEPDHRLLRSIAVIVRGPIRGDDEVAALHCRPLAFHRRIGALAVQHEPDRRGGMAMGGGDLARQDQLQAGVERLGDARLAAQRRVFQHQHPALRLFRGDQFAGFGDQRLGVLEMPDRRHALGDRLARHQVAEHLPQRRHVVGGDAVVIGAPRRFDVLARRRRPRLTAGFPRARDTHGVLLFLFLVGFRQYSKSRRGVIARVCGRPSNHRARKSPEPSDVGGYWVARTGPGDDTQSDQPQASGGAAGPRTIRRARSYAR